MEFFENFKKWNRISLLNEKKSALQIYVLEKLSTLNQFNLKKKKRNFKRLSYDNTDKQYLGIVLWNKNFPVGDRNQNAKHWPWHNQ